MLDLVALGTIADVVPLVGTNRILVTHGLKLLGEGERLGVRALKRVAGIADDAPVAAGQVGFRLGPRINAAGRLDDAATAVELLLSRDPGEATLLAQRLDEANAQRQTIEREITKAAIAQATPRAEKVRGLVLYGEGWHPGVVGIVASRVVDRFHRPAVVIGVDGESAKGSCRSIEKFHMYEALGHCREHLVRYGGHHHAAGVTLAAGNIEAFRVSFEAEAMRQLQASDLEPSMKVDADLYFGDATLPLAEALVRLGPFGAGNPEPVFATELASIESRVLPAKDGGPDHLKFRIGEADAIAFGLGDKQGVLRTRAKVAFQLGLDSWQGRTKASAKVKAIEGRG
jgi:single-stranded-DNA-specific exonuclease